MEFFVVAARFTRFGALKIDQFNNIKFDQRFFFVFLGLVGVQTISNSLPPKASSRIRDFRKNVQKANSNSCVKLCLFIIFPPCVSEILTPFHIIKVENTSEVLENISCSLSMQESNQMNNVCLRCMLLQNFTHSSLSMLHHSSIFHIFGCAPCRLKYQQIVNLASKTISESSPLSFKTP